MYFKTNINHKLFFCLCVSIYSHNVFSANNSYIMTLSGGPTWGNANNRVQTLYLTPEIEKTYTANKSSQTLATGELFLGIQRALKEKLQGQIGLAVATMSKAKQSGDIWEDADPTFNNYTYQYYVNHIRIALKGKLLIDMGSFLTPWISASAGIGFNDSFHFSSTPTFFEAQPTPNFASHTQTAFAYTLGIGFQHTLNKNWQIGMGYEFADWGKSQLSTAQGQTLNNTLALSHFYTQGILLSMSYNVS